MPTPSCGLPTLLIARSQWDALSGHLFSPDQAENFAFGLARPCAGGAGLVFLLEAFESVGPRDYAYRSGGGLRLTDEASSRLNHVSLKAARLGRQPVHFHSHPDGLQGFSGVDDAHERALHRFLVAEGQPSLWSVVCPRGGAPAVRVWQGQRAFAAALRVGWGSHGPPHPTLSPALARQRVFGPGLVGAAQQLRVGIVGLGGLGMLVAEQLARCGFRDFVLVDPDTVDLSNLNRLPGARRGDVGRPKVAVARALIRRAADALGSRAQVRALQKDIYTASRRTVAALETCDVILAVTDNHLSRQRCLEIAMDSGAHYLQAGVDIRTDQDGRISELLAEVTGADPGRFCPVCTGRLDLEQAGVEARVMYTTPEIREHALREGYTPKSVAPAPAVMSLNSVAAGLLVMEVQRRVAGLSEHDLIQVEVNAGRLCLATFQQSSFGAGCPYCGRTGAESQAHG